MTRFLASCFGFCRRCWWWWRETGNWCSTAICFPIWRASWQVKLSFSKSPAGICVSNRGISCVSIIFPSIRPIKPRFPRFHRVIHCFKAWNQQKPHRFLWAAIAFARCFPANGTGDSVPTLQTRWAAWTNTTTIETSLPHRSKSSRCHWSGTWQACIWPKQIGEADFFWEALRWWQQSDTKRFESMHSTDLISRIRGMKSRMALWDTLRNRRFTDSTKSGNRRNSDRWVRWREGRRRRRERCVGVRWNAWRSWSLWTEWRRITTIRLSAMRTFCSIMFLFWLGLRGSTPCSRITESSPRSMWQGGRWIRSFFCRPFWNAEECRTSLRASGSMWRGQWAWKRLRLPCYMR